MRVESQSPILDEQRSLLRGVSEECRTWALKEQRIKTLLNNLGTFETISLAPDGMKLAQSLSKMLSVALGHAEAAPSGKASSEGNTTEKMFTLLKSCANVVASVEEAKERLVTTVDGAIHEVLREMTPATLSRDVSKDSASSPQGPGAAGADTESQQDPESAHKDSSGTEQRTLDEAELWPAFQEASKNLDLEYLDVVEELCVAELTLKELEEELFQQWLKTKKASEHWSCLKSAFVGTREAMRLAKVRYEREKERLGQAERESEPRFDNVETSSVATQESSATYGTSVHPEVAGAESDEDKFFTLGDYWAAEGSTKDAKRREEILKANHPGSELHPHGCRACHFQGGLCWQGLACSFCHICPKPKRKSKHQRDVDKRRQEKYRQVKAEHGSRCLDLLTKVDECRRQVMTISEELKRKVKDAYAAADDAAVNEAQEMANAVAELVEKFASKVKDAGILCIPSMPSSASKSAMDVSQPIEEEGAGDDTDGTDTSEPKTEGLTSSSTSVAEQVNAEGPQNTSSHPVSPAMTNFYGDLKKERGPSSQGKGGRSSPWGKWAQKGGGQGGVSSYKPYLGFGQAKYQWNPAFKGGKGGPGQFHGFGGQMGYGYPTNDWSKGYDPETGGYAKGAKDVYRDWSEMQEPSPFDVWKDGPETWKGGGLEAWKGGGLDPWTGGVAESWMQ